MCHAPPLTSNPGDATCRTQWIFKERMRCPKRTRYSILSPLLARTSPRSIIIPSILVGSHSLLVPALWKCHLSRCREIKSPPFSSPGGDILDGRNVSGGEFPTVKKVSLLYLACVNTLPLGGELCDGGDFLHSQESLPPETIHRIRSLPRL